MCIGAVNNMGYVDKAGTIDIVMEAIEQIGDVKEQIGNLASDVRAVGSKLDHLTNRES